MPNYSLVINSQFKPATYEQYAAPLRELATYHEKVNTEYEKLADEAYMLENLANNAKDANEYAKYKGYSDKLKASMDELNDRGLSGSTRRDLMNLRRQYRSEIRPLTNAYKLREEENKIRREADIKSGNRIVYDKNANVGISSYMNGNRPTYGSTNLDTLMSEATMLGKAISSRRYSMTEGNLAGNQLIDIITKTGMDSNAMMDMMQNPNKPEYKDFADAIQTLKDKVGWDNYDVTEQKRMGAAMMQGLTNGVVYNEDHKPMNNPNVMTAAERDASARGWASHRLSQQQLNITAQINGFTKDSKGNYVRDNTVEGGYDLSDNPYITPSGETIVKIVPNGKDKFYGVDSDGNIVMPLTQSQATNIINSRSITTPKAPKTSKSKVEIVTGKDASGAGYTSTIENKESYHIGVTLTQSEIKSILSGKKIKVNNGSEFIEIDEDMIAKLKQLYDKYGDNAEYKINSSTGTASAKFTDTLNQATAHAPVWQQDNNSSSNNSKDVKPNM